MQLIPLNHEDREEVGVLDLGASGCSRNAGGAWKAAEKPTSFTHPHLALVLGGGKKRICLYSFLGQMVVQ